MSHRCDRMDYIVITLLVIILGVTLYIRLGMHLGAILPGRL